MNLLCVKEAADALKISHPQARKMIAGSEPPADMVDGVLHELTEVPAMIDGVNGELGAG